MNDIITIPSRRALLGTLVAVPAMTAGAAKPWHDALALLDHKYGNEAVTLVRSRAGRSLSLARFHRAEEFLPGTKLPATSGWHHFLYNAGITAQLGLSSHLLDVGFSDTWCASQIGLRVAKSLEYANASGFGYDCPDTMRLALVLTPYWKWNRPAFPEQKPDDGGFKQAEVCRLLCGLLDHVHHVTGHRHIRGWKQHRIE